MWKLSKVQLFRSNKLIHKISIREKCNPTYIIFTVRFANILSAKHSQFIREREKCCWRQNINIYYLCQYHYVSTHVYSDMRGKSYTSTVRVWFKTFFPKVMESTSRVPFRGAGHAGDHIFHAPRAKPCHYAANLHTLSVTSPLHASALTDTMDNLSEKCPNALTDIHCLFLYDWSYMLLQGPHIPPMAFTICHDPGSNLLPSDERVGTLIMQSEWLA